MPSLARLVHMGEGHATWSQSTGVFLCADDFAMTNGISRAIVELAEAHRISATSAMTTTTHWPAHATWLARIRGNIATGLHLNLTLGAPLSVMPKLAPDRLFPVIGRLTTMAVRGSLDRDEIATEIERQITVYEREMGFSPDHIDGHQHVHALPIVRDALFDVLAKRFPIGGPRPLLRSPTDSPLRNLRRRTTIAKALTLSWLTRGFAEQARRSGFPTNVGFSGITTFGPHRASADLMAACRSPGSRQMIMCHPGFVDEELARIDPVTERRQREFDVLREEAMPLPIWRPQRSATGPPVSWPTAWISTVE
jgi:chitin disaccharide deacetylase